jgi:hypothetical protein
MRKLLLLIILLLMIGIMPTAAQEDEAPLLRMLARIPNSALAREELSYIDYQALIGTREGATAVGSWEEFNTLMDSREDGAGLLIAALNGAKGGPQFLQYIMSADDVSGVLGFDFFEVERAVSFGQPPATVVMVEGDFDEAAVIAAHEARDYTQSEAGDLTLLCSAAGCDQGMMTNLQDRNPSNLFGGELGRSQPVLVGDNWIASSPSDVSLDEVANAADNSLAEQPDYRAAAEALTANGTLRQSWFIQPTSITSVTDMLIGARMTQEQIDALKERFEEDFVPMPAYSLAVLADVVTEDEQQAIIALVFYNEADAEAAAVLFPERLTNSLSLRVNAPFGEVLEDRGVTSVDTEVVTSSNRSVVLVKLHAPLPPSTRVDDRFVASSLPYGVLVDAYFARDLAWLAPTL